MEAAPQPKCRRAEGQQSCFGRLVLAGGAALIVCSALLGASLPVRAQISSSEEYRLKLAFLYNFAKFVEWPADAFPSPQEPLNICIVGRDPFDSELEQQVSERTINGHPCVTRRLRPTDDLSTCHVIFVPAGSDSSLPAVLKQASATGAITVGESTGFASRGGTANFVLQGTRLRFEVNLAASQRARSRISSRVLALAKIIRD